MKIFIDPPDNTNSSQYSRSGTAKGEEEEAKIEVPTKLDTMSRQKKSLAGQILYRMRLSDSTSRLKWYAAFKNVLPIYIAVHLAVFATSCLAFLFTVPDFSPRIMNIAALWQQWHYWDTSHYTHIALNGYKELSQAAFFPLYPLLERGGMFVTGDPLIAGLLISNVAELIMFVALYRLIEEDFNGEGAYHTVLYLSIFPTAFFFSAAYTESLFLCLSVLSFYNMRQGRWWLAGVFGFFASLTRPDGMYLLLPFCYEYLRQTWLQQGEPFRLRHSIGQMLRLLKAIRFDILFGLFFPAGVILFMFYGYYRFHDLLAFVHAHAAWSRSLHFPGWGILVAIREISMHGFLSFLTMRTMIDLTADLLVLALIVLSFVGPWKLPKNLWVYGLYAAMLFLYFQLFPKDNTAYPLESMSRFVLEIFPAFITLSRISKYRTLHLSYCMLSGAIFFFLLTQFLTNHWVL
jgi:hypothetical protein